MRKPFLSQRASSLALPTGRPLVGSQPVWTRLNLCSAWSISMTYFGCHSTAWYGATQWGSTVSDHDMPSEVLSSWHMIGQLVCRKTSIWRRTAW